MSINLNQIKNRGQHLLFSIALAIIGLLGLSAYAEAAPKLLLCAGDAYVHPVKTTAGMSNLTLGHPALYVAGSVNYWADAPPGADCSLATGVPPRINPIFSNGNDSLLKLLNYGNGAFGLETLGVGQTTISASYAGLSDSVRVTVLDRLANDPDPAPAQQPTLAVERANCSIPIGHSTCVASNPRAYITDSRELTRDYDITNQQTGVTAVGALKKVNNYIYEPAANQLGSSVFVLKYGPNDLRAVDVGSLDSVRINASCAPGGEWLPQTGRCEAQPAPSFVFSVKGMCPSDPGSVFWVRAQLNKKVYGPGEQIKIASGEISYAGTGTCAEDKAFNLTVQIGSGRFESVFKMTDLYSRPLVDLRGLVLGNAPASGPSANIILQGYAEMMPSMPGLPTNSNPGNVVISTSQSPAPAPAPGADPTIAQLLKMIEDLSKLVIDLQRQVLAMQQGQLPPGAPQPAPIPPQPSGQQPGLLVSRIDFTLYHSTKMEMDVIFADGSRLHKPITSLDVDSLVMSSYGGNYAAYQMDYNRNAELVRQGKPTPDIYNLVADLLGMTPVEVERVIFTYLR